MSPPPPETDAAAAARYARRARAAADWLRGEAARSAADMDRAMDAFRRRLRQRQGAPPSPPEQGAAAAADGADGKGELT